MQDPQKELVERLQQAQNILVTVSADPSVDQLAAAIGLTLALNQLNKHATAVFSGQVPSTLEFLKPEDTLEKNTDSLRDFIIALDKNKADKLRYKVEDNVVRIFITPYKTSITDKDLDFSQGDFNVDVVVALGVHEQQQLDAAITAHGRILHDATVASLNTVASGELGTIHWLDTTVSSLSEMVVNLVDALGKEVLDGQIATALLTGIVATTERFSNDKTSPKTMSASAELMAAGANQQLIATQLSGAAPATTNNDAAAPAALSQPAESAAPDAAASVAPAEAETPKSEANTLEIKHPEDEEERPAPAENAEAESGLDTTVEPAQPQTPKPQIHVGEDGQFTSDHELPSIGPVRGGGGDSSMAEKSDETATDHKRITEEPSRSGDLTANTAAEELDPSTDELTLPSLGQPILNHGGPFVPAPAVPLPAPQIVDEGANQNTSSDSGIITPDETLAEVEKAVDSPHLAAATTLDSARSAVEAAFAGGAGGEAQNPIASLHAQPLGPELHEQHGAPVSAPVAPPSVAPTNMGFSEPSPGNSPADASLDMPLPNFGQPAAANPAAQFGVPPAPSAFPGTLPANDHKQDPNAPPPVPPPMLPPLQ